MLRKKFEEDLLNYYSDKIADKSSGSYDLHKKSVDELKEYNSKLQKDIIYFNERNNELSNELTNLQNVIDSTKTIEKSINDNIYHLKQSWREYKEKDSKQTRELEDLEKELKDLGVDFFVEEKESEKDTNDNDFFIESESEKDTNDNDFFVEESESEKDANIFDTIKEKNEKVNFLAYCIFIDC